MRSPAFALVAEPDRAESEFEREAFGRFLGAAERAGFAPELVPRAALRRVGEFGAVFLRIPTDPENVAYAWSRHAEMLGIPVLDDSRSILVCCDKVHMHGRLTAAGVPTPRTVVLRRREVSRARGALLLAALGTPVIVKAPHSSFSSHVEKVTTPEAFAEVGERFLDRSDRIVVQEFVQSRFDWRVGVLDGEPLYACRYVIPQGTFKILDVVDGEEAICDTEPVAIPDVPPGVLSVALAAAGSIGRGLYGVDLKEADGRVVVIEVNDNPTIGAEHEDGCAPDLYDRIVGFLAAARPPVGTAGAPAPAG